MNIAKYSHVVTWQQPAALQSSSGSKCVSVCTVWSDLTVQLQYSCSVTTGVTWGWTFVCINSNAFGHWLGHWQWLAVNIDWLLTVTIYWTLLWLTVTIDWLLTVTFYWTLQWLTVTIDWLLTVTIYWTLQWLTVTIDWTLTVTITGHWQLLSYHWLDTDSYHNRTLTVTELPLTGHWQLPLAGHWQYWQLPLTGHWQDYFFNQL